MDKKELMYTFIKSIEKNKILTKFIQNIFEYSELNDYNYLFRLTKDNDSVIFDIYDNISENRFNRYIFYFNKDIDIDNFSSNNVYVTNINVIKAHDSNKGLYKLAYLFNIDNDKMIKYARIRNL